MAVETTQAYIATVGPDHTIVLPDDIAVGSTVVVVLMANPSEPDHERHARFKATLEAIRAASTAEAVSPPVTSTDLDALIKKARQTSNDN